MPWLVPSALAKGVVCVTFRKVRAHAERRIFQELTDCGPQARADALGNLQADVLATHATDLLALPLVLVRVVTAGDELLFSLMRRCLAVESAHWAHYGQDAMVPRAPSMPKATCFGGAKGPYPGFGACVRRLRKVCHIFVWLVARSF